MAGKPKQSGLGRGLGELFQKTEETDSKTAVISDGSQYAQIPLDQIIPNPKQPRQVFDEDKLDELVASIAEFGVLQPVVVRKIDQDKYELVMGERRLRASKLAKQSTIPAIIRGTEDTALLRDALLENLHRANLNPLEEASAYNQMLEDFNCTQEELSKKIKRSRSQIANTIRLLKLPYSVQLKVAANTISAGHARALLVLEDALSQEILANRIIAEGLSVRATEELVTINEPKKNKRKASVRTPSEKAIVLAEQLSDHFDTRVKVSIGKSRGRIMIEFAGEEDLDRILNIIDLD